MAKKYMNRGELVPDEVVEAMMEEKLRRVPPASGILLDGFPRTAEQIKFLQTLFKEIGRSLDAVILFNVSDEEIKNRLSGRLICRDCLAPFHKTLAPFTTCPHDKCKGEHLAPRSDDTRELIQIRLRVFHRAIEPVLQFYQQANRLLLFDAEGSMKAVAEKLSAAFVAVREKRARFASEHDLTKRQKPPPFVPTLIPTKTAKPPSLDLVVMGAPGSGKGTQAAAVAGHFRIRHISSGELFREHLKCQTELGKLARSYMDRGELLPDEVTDAMVATRLAQADTVNGFILDGYPRTRPQALALNDVLVELRRKLQRVVYIRVPDEIITQRLSGRLICKQCQSPYHLQFKPPAQTGLCDLCGGPLLQRDDDNPETVRARLKVYHTQTEPLIEYYRAENLLSEIDGTSDVNRVRQEAVKAVTRAGIPLRTAFTAAS